jgi:hypothetical protein
VGSVRAAAVVEGRAVNVQSDTHFDEIIVDDGKGVASELSYDYYQIIDGEIMTRKL